MSSVVINWRYIRQYSIILLFAPIVAILGCSNEQSFEDDKKSEIDIVKNNTVSSSNVNDKHLDNELSSIVDQKFSQTDENTPLLPKDNLVSQGNSLSNDKKLNQNAEFEKFKQDFLVRMWELHPSEALSYGYYDHDDILLIPNGTLRAQRRSFYVNELQALKQFNVIQLDPVNVIDFTIIESELRKRVWFIDEYRSYEWNPAHYTICDSFKIIANTNYLPVNDRLQAIYKRLEKVPEYYLEVQKNIKNPSTVHLDYAIQLNTETLNIFNVLIPGLLIDTELAPTEADQFDILLKDASSATRNFINWLEQFTTKNKDQLDTSNLSTILKFEQKSRTKDKYVTKFEYEVNSNFEIHDLYELALTSKEQLHEQMLTLTEELWHKYFPNESLETVDLIAVSKMIKELSKKHSKPDQIINATREQLTFIREFIINNDVISDLGVDGESAKDLIIRPIGKLSEQAYSVSISSPTPYDKARDVFYNINTFDSLSQTAEDNYLQKFNYWMSQIVHMQEYMPGNYIRRLHINKSASLINQIFSNGATQSGWNAYAVKLMFDEGYAVNEPEMKLFYNKWRLSMAMNTVFDYQINALGTPKNEAVDYLVTMGFEDVADAEQKFNTAILSPGSLSETFAGYSDMVSIREQIEDKNDDEFNLKQFNTQVLNYGNAPLTLIKSLILAPVYKINNIEELNTDEPQDTKSNLN